MLYSVKHLVKLIKQFMSVIALFISTRFFFQQIIIVFVTIGFFTAAL